MTKEQVSLTSLFVPGEGSAPPFLAGREPELAEIMAVADRLGYSDPEIQIPPSNIVIFGPRGNGKTVLLQEAVKRIRAYVQESGKSLQVALLTAKMISSKQELRQALAPGGGWKKFWERLKNTRPIETIKGALGDEDETEQLVDRAFDQFKRLGFVWESGDSFEPGIPSLMDYIANRYEAGRAATRASMDDEVPFWNTQKAGAEGLS